MHFAEYWIDIITKKWNGIRRRIRHTLRNTPAAGHVGCHVTASTDCRVKAQVSAS
jgi:hypothetical protein